MFAPFDLQDASEVPVARRQLVRALTPARVLHTAPDSAFRATPTRTERRDRTTVLRHVP
jgi:hypothetical protein